MQFNYELTFLFHLYKLLMFNYYEKVKFVTPHHKYNLLPKYSALLLYFQELNPNVFIFSLSLSLHKSSMCHSFLLNRLWKTFPSRLRIKE